MIARGMPVQIRCSRLNGYRCGTAVFFHGRASFCLLGSKDVPHRYPPIKSALPVPPTMLCFRESPWRRTMDNRHSSHLPVYSGKPRGRGVRVPPPLEFPKHPPGANREAPGARPGTTGHILDASGAYRCICLVADVLDGGPTSIMCGSNTRPVWGTRYFPRCSHRGFRSKYRDISGRKRKSIRGRSKGHWGFCGRPVRFPECSSAW